MPESYLAQFQQDFSTFLKLRSNEIVSGGKMVITFLGRNKLDPLDGEMNSLWGLLAKALNSLVSEVYKSFHLQKVSLLYTYVYSCTNFLQNTEKSL